MISELSIAYALSFLGTPYVYGGNGPAGVDCSGFVILVLQAEGILNKRFDATAQGLYTFLKVNGAREVKHPSKGCLAFYGKSKTKITHVGLCLSSHQLIQSSGGDSTTKSRQDAEKRGAHVNIAPIGHRLDLVAFLTLDTKNIIPLR